MRKLTTEELITRYKIIHNDFYDYSDVKYNGIKNTITIICPKHGKFDQIAADHIDGHGCAKCAIEKNTIKKRNNLQDLINRANKLHNNRYDYSLITSYKSMHDYQNIICLKHGIFSITLHSHINKSRGCKKCAIDKSKDNKTDFILKSKKIHGNKYDYSKVNYVNSKTKVKIICLKHGKFEQAPNYHILGQGCPICNESKGERLVSTILESLNLEFISQKTFKDLKHKYLLRFDFYIPILNICIEFDGEQHFRPIMGWGGEELFKEVKIRDSLKNNYCDKNYIPLLRVSYIDYNNGILKKKLLNFLKNKKKEKK